MRLQALGPYIDGDTDSGGFVACYLASRSDE